MSNGNHVFMAKILKLIQANVNGKQKQPKKCQRQKRCASMKFDRPRQLHVVPLRLQIGLLPLLCIVKVLLSLGIWMMCSSTTYGLTHMTLNKTMRNCSSPSKITNWFPNPRMKWLRLILYGVPFVWPQVMWQLLLY